MANGYINQVTLPDSSKYSLTDSTLKVYSGTCDTAAGTAIKDVTCPEHFSLTKGAVVFVTFANTNSVTISSIQLRVNSSVTADAKPIKYLYNGNDPANIPSAAYLRANQTYMFHYDGTNWVARLHYNTNSTYSYMRPYENTAKGSYSTTAANPAKTAAAGWKFDLTAGKYFMYTHYHTNAAAAALTLNIGGTGAKPIYINGSPSSSSNHTLPGGQYLVYYDGTNYQFRTDDKMPGNIDGDAATVSGFTVGKAVPSTAVFTDTWIPLSTTQGGYVSTAAPDDNKKFLRGDATWATLPAASSTVAGITKIGASGGAAAYSHGEHVTTATVKEALGTSTTHNNQFLRKDGTWQTVNTDAGVTSIGTLTGDITASDLITELKLSTAMHFRGIATTAVTEGSKTNPNISGYTFGTDGASALAGDVIIDKDSQYEYIWTKDGNTGSWELLGSSEAYSLSDHTHGNLTNDGKITTTATIANGDKLVIVDSDNTAKSKIVGSSITFDGSTTSQALTPAGTWETFNNYTHPTGDGNSHVPETGTTNAGLYLKAGSTANSASWEEPPVWWGTCKTEAATVNKEVNDCPGFVLKNGAVIFVWFKYTNSGGISSITLNVQGTGAKHIKYLSNTSDPGNIPDKADIRANQTYMFRYSDNGTNQYWVIDLPQDTNDGLNYLRHYTIKAQTAITAGHILGGTDNGYNNIDNGSAFDIRYAVLYCAANLTANQTGYKNYVFHYAINIKNSSNSNIAFTAWKNIYIKGTINGNIFTPISGGNPYVQDITAADDGYVYYYIGRSYNTSAMTFDATSKAIYWYKDGAIRPYNHFAARSKAAVLTTTANDVAYYTDTNGTFGSISSADGALYSTTANGTLQWGTLPTGQGGTGKTSWTQWGIVYANATDTLGQVTAGAAGNSGLALISNGATAPGWYGGLSLTGTTAGNYVAIFKGSKAATSTSAAAVVITGGIATGGNSYMSKTVHFVGAAADDPIMTRGISGANSGGQRGANPTASDQGLYLNVNGGPVIVGKNDATATNQLQVAYTCDASSKDTGAFIVAGGAGIGKKLYVGTQAIIAKIKIGNGTTDAQQRTITVTDTNLIFDTPTGRGIVFQQNATTKMRMIGEAFYPETTNTGTLGLDTGVEADARRWSAAYIGTANTYGDSSLPIYWDNGVPTYTNGILQKKNFSFSSGASSVVLEDTAYNQLYGIETFVIQIVVIEGEEYLNSPISWTSAQKNNSTTTGIITLSCTTATSGIVNGYILTARGIDLTPTSQSNI